MGARRTTHPLHEPYSLCPIDGSRRPSARNERRVHRIAALWTPAARGLIERHAAVGDKRNPDSSKDSKHRLLDEFSERFGEKPLSNKYGGRKNHIDHQYLGDWSTPLDNRGKRNLWEIRPSEKNA